MSGYPAHGAMTLDRYALLRSSAGSNYSKVPVARKLICINTPHRFRRENKQGLARTGFFVEEAREYGSQARIVHLI